MSTLMRSAPLAGSVWQAFVADLYLTIVAPTSFREQLRRVGVAFLVEALFLLLISAAAPVGTLALASLLVGEAVVVASFAPAGSPRGRVAGR